MSSSEAAEAFAKFDDHTDICVSCAHADYCLDGLKLRQEWLKLEALAHAR